MQEDVQKKHHHTVFSLSLYITFHLICTKTTQDRFKHTLGLTALPNHYEEEETTVVEDASGTKNYQRTALLPKLNLAMGNKSIITPPVRI